MWTYKTWRWSFVVIALVLMSCALPEGQWTIDTRLEPVGTAWIGGPPMATEEAEAEETAIAIVTEEAPQVEVTPEACLIKGNVSNSGDMVYHMPGGVYYDRVKVDHSQGDRFFCLESEAVDAGFRRSTR